MLGLILVSVGTFFDELSTLLGKWRVERNEQTIFSMAFLGLVWSTLWFLGIILYKWQFVFSLESLPTFLVRLVAEIILTHITTIAIIRSDRSTFGFVRTGTIPLLLLADLILGYTLTFSQVTGMVILVMVLLFAFLNHGLRKEGLRFVVLATLLPVLSTALYKYDITHFNSVEAEQFIVQLAMLIYLFVMAMRSSRENPLVLLTKPAFFVQSFAAGIGGVLISFAFVFAPASTVMAAKRAVAVLWAILSGNLYFREKGLIEKILLFAIVTVGIILLA